MQRPPILQPIPETTEGLAPAQNAPAVTARGRYEFLDAVRGLAALLVAVQHGAEHLGLALGRRTAPLNLGETGVVAFFLVSGFIIPLSLERYGSLARFWAGRAFRLYPAYWLSLVGTLALIAAGRFPSAFAGLPHPALAVAANGLMLQQLFHAPNAVGVYWTLGLELIFYLLCSALFAAGLLRRSSLCLLGAIGAMLLALLAAAARHRSLPAGLLGLLLSAFYGAMALRALTDPHARRMLLATAPAMLAVLTLGLYLRFVSFPVPHQLLAPTFSTILPSWMLGYALFFGLFILRERPFPPVLLSLGRISYSFYLWHVLVITSMPALGNPRLSLLLDLLVTAAIAELSFRFVEAPTLRLGRRLLAPRRA